MTIYYRDKNVMSKLLGSKYLYTIKVKGTLTAAHIFEEVDTSDFFYIKKKEINCLSENTPIESHLVIYYNSDKYFFKSEKDYILWKLKYGL